MAKKKTQRRKQRRAKKLVTTTHIVRTQRLGGDMVQILDGLFTDLPGGMFTKVAIGASVVVVGAVVVKKLFFSVPEGDAVIDAVSNASNTTKNPLSASERNEFFRSGGSVKGDTIAEKVAALRAGMNTRAATPEIRIAG